MVTFRVSTSQDKSAIVALVESAYRGESSRTGWSTEADLLDGQRTDPDEIAEILEDRHARLLLAVTAGRVVGCVLVREELNGAYIGMLAVEPALQAAGLGRALLSEAETLGRELFGVEHFRMTVIEQRPELIAWYERRGYRVTGKREPFPYGNARFGIPKRDDLRFVVLEKHLGLPHRP